jgi:hypothetical protein
MSFLHIPSFLWKILSRGTLLERGGKGREGKGKKLSDT